MIRAILGAVLGAAAAAAALLALTLLDPALTLELNRDVPRPIASGLYPVEEVGDETYAWTGPLTTFTFRELSRRAAWRCVARLRGPRPAGLPHPEVSLAVDGVTISKRLAGPHYEDVELLAPARDREGLRLAISASPIFVPPTDPRELGVQLDRLTCEPQEGAWVLPPRHPLIAVTVGGAAFGALFGLLGTAFTATLASVVFGVAIAWLAGSGIAPFAASYLNWFPPFALWITLPALAISAITMKRTSGAARFVLAFSAAILFLNLATLMHPSKAVVDAVFHAHRLEWVMGGRYFFTQPMPGGVQFPYAIALYVTALPFASLIPDHVALLRIVVCLFEIIGAGLLYAVVARLWHDRLAAALAVVCYHLVPLPYAVIGNANLTYAFGHAVSLIAFAAVSLLTLRWRKPLSLATLFLVAAVAFLSHVAVFPLLGVALFLTGVLYARSRDLEVRPSAWPIVGVSVLAAIVAFGVYYAHFPEVYQTLDRVRSTTVDGAPAAAQTPAPPSLSIPARAGRAVTLGLRDLGVPLALLAGAGVWLRFRSRRDRLDLGLAAWGASFVLFVGFRIVAPVDPRLQRYADEFIDRVYYATLPAFVVLAAYAAAGGWRAGGARRVITLAVFAAAVSVGITTWASWIS